MRGRLGYSRDGGIQIAAVSCKLSEETKQKLIQLVAKQGETLNAHLVELVEADVQMMEESEKESSNPGNPGPSSDLLECPECKSMVAIKSFMGHWKALHGKKMTGTDFENFMKEMISERGGQKFSQDEITCLKSIHDRMVAKGFLLIE